MRAPIVVVLLGLTACSAPMALHSRFDPAEIAWFSRRGTNTIEGTAIARSYRGAVKTCAAQTVTLFPVSTYASERMTALYGNAKEGFNPVTAGRPADFEGDDPAYHEAARTMRCDGRGRFAFSELADGAYFVVAEVTWHDRRAGLEQGGYLMQRVEVASGETRDILLAH